MRTSTGPLFPRDAAAYRRPEHEVRARACGRQVHLHGRILDAAGRTAFSSFWMQDEGNPARVDLVRIADDHAAFTVPEGAPDGEYGFSRVLMTGDGPPCRARALVALRGGRIRPFRVETDHASWIDRAVVYGATPYIFVKDGRLRDVTRKIPELARLGVNTLWLQPIYPTRNGGQGYDVLDYFTVNPALGTEEDFRALMAESKSHGLRVLLDFVLNHAPIHHPLAQRAGREGPGIFQKEIGRTRYSRCFRKRADGSVYCFWPDMPNLDHGHPEVRAMLIDAGRHWIERFDIDGYRVDAAWGVSSRSPGFLREWRLALKRIKPEILILGEDKAVDAQAFEAGLDAAYDWSGHPGWISQWAWQTEYHAGRSLTLFNDARPAERPALLRAALTNGGRGYARGRKVFRYLENNDTPRFLPDHGLDATRMAAALSFVLPGIPSLYNGQEIGSLRHPHATDQVFAADRPIRDLDECGLFPFYQALIRLRLGRPALHGPRFEPVQALTRDPVLAFRRGEGEDALLCAFNLGDAPAAAWLPRPPGAGEGTFRVTLEPYGFRILAWTEAGPVDLAESLPRRAPPSAAVKAARVRGKAAARSA